MSQGPLAQPFGVVAPTLAAGVAASAGAPIQINSSGDAALGAKDTGNNLPIGLAQRAAAEGTVVPVQFGGTLSLSEAEWDAVAKSGGSASTTGLTPGAWYSIYTSGIINTGNGIFAEGDILWNLGVALSSTTMLIMPCALAKAN